MTGIKKRNNDLYIYYDLCDEVAALLGPVDYGHHHLVIVGSDVEESVLPLRVHQRHLLQLAHHRVALAARRLVPVAAELQQHPRARQPVAKVTQGHRLDGNKTCLTNLSYYWEKYVALYAIGSSSRSCGSQ